MPPFARDEQLELDRAQSALAAVLFGEGDERAADPGTALIGGCDQYSELACVICDAVNADAAGDLAVRVATAICPARISAASSESVVRVASSRQSPCSAIAYTSLTSRVRWSTSSALSAADASRRRTGIVVCCGSFVRMGQELPP